MERRLLQFALKNISQAQLIMRQYLLWRWYYRLVFPQTLAPLSIISR
ncbi:hypothetical protein [Sulfobacillus thermosulfidooxidans]|nr:hypothetical protein [Sulfobacillus thermosulfidooxidans]